MKGTAKVIMGATLVMVVTLGMVLGLVLVLLAELCCSLLLRRRQLRNTTAAAATTDSSSQPQQLPMEQSAAAQPLRSFYAQGVLNAPRRFLFPEVPSKEGNVDIEKQQPQLHQILEAHIQEPHQIGLVTLSPEPIQKVLLHSGGSTSNDAIGGGGGGGGGKQFIYISNPIYDNEAGRPDTPFETPDTSPSRLEMGGSSGDDEDKDPSISSPTSPSSVPNTPPLTPMKKLPSEACSVSLSMRDARSLATSGSDSNSNNGVSSSTSGSPCTSPSW